MPQANISSSTSAALSFRPFGVNFWQYKLGLFTPNGLNERAADVELDIFACGTA